METLHLNLKKKWFDMIASGEKKTEYRDQTEYWEKRLINIDEQNRLDAGLSLDIAFRDFQTVTFSNGYSKDRRQMVIKIESFEAGFGKEEWGALKNNWYYKINLGRIIMKNF